MYYTHISNLALERSGAVVTRKRFESGVFAAVSDEIRRLTESLTALTTNVRLLALSYTHTLHSITQCNDCISDMF